MAVSGSAGWGASANGVHTEKARTSPFSLTEALPFSPQTSVVPFIPDFVPEPSVGSGPAAPHLFDVFDPTSFDSANQNDSIESQGLRSSKQVADAVLHDLKHNRRTHYKFKPFLNPTSRGTSKPTLPALSPFSRTVFEKISSLYRQPQIESAEANGGKEAPSDVKLEAPAAKLSPSLKDPGGEPHTPGIPSTTGIAVPVAHKEENDDAQAGRSTAAVPTNLGARASPARSNPQSSSTQACATPKASAPAMSIPPRPATIAVELPAVTFNKDEYVTVPDVPDAPLNLSRRNTKSQTYAGSRDVLSSSLDSRQRADAALHDLGVLTREVYHAVGLATGGMAIDTALATLSPDHEPVLTASTHQRVQASIQKTIGLQCFDKIPLEDLQLYQRLCDNSLRQCAGLELGIDESWGEAEVQSWLRQLSEAEACLKAARTALRIMSGGRSDKRLYSEEAIHQTVELFKRAMDNVVVPVAELRVSGSSSGLFKLLAPHRKAIGSVFISCQRLFALLASLVASIELSDTVLNTLEFAASRLMFVENTTWEKDSVMGVQKFDGIRLVAMDMLCQIFLLKPQQRRGIFDDILTSLEKLPVGKQSARQFKLSDGGSIQPVSALIMRLVQASAGQVGSRRAPSAGSAWPTSGEDSPEALASQEPTLVLPKPSTASIESEDDGASRHADAVKELSFVSNPLAEAARRDATYVINFIVNRALKSTKSGDTPYRNLLDLFVEDFTECLHSPDWPAAELLLRVLMFMMVKLSEGDKTSAPAKNMALELLGAMGAAISRLRSHARKSAASLMTSHSDELARFLAELAHASLEQNARPGHMLDWSGPFRATIECLDERRGDDTHLRSAMSFLVMNWATQVCALHDSSRAEVAEQDEELGRLSYRLMMMTEDPAWLRREYTFKPVPAAHAKLAYTTILLRSPLCEAFGAILNILLGSMASDQATVRSKSLKSVNQVLETDPSILDGDSVVIQLILQCSGDSSTQVRDSALGLIGKCLNMRPSLEEGMVSRIVDRFVDTGVGVRKRAMKLARDVYLRNRRKDIRSSIVNGLLHRVQDPDEGVRELARQMIEEVWFTPFYGMERDAAFKTALTEHVSLMIQTVKNGNVGAILDKVFQSILGSRDKGSGGPSVVCSELVASTFELTSSLDSDDPLVPSGRDALQVLMIFAKADPGLFTYEQVKLLKPHLEAFGSMDELAVFRAVVVIYRRVLPQFCSATYNDFLRLVRNQLQGAIGKVPKAVLDDVIACLDIIYRFWKSMEVLARIAASSLSGLAKLSAAALDHSTLVKMTQYMNIVGMIGKHCDLDSSIEIFKKGASSEPQTASVSTLMVKSLIPFATPDQAREVRKCALDAIGLVCQSWPRNYVLPTVYTTFQDVFDEQDLALETMILRSMKEFLLAEERRSEAASGAAEPASVDGTKKKELTVMGGTNYDDVASATTQRFLRDITRIALSTQDDHALLAVEVLASINRQGLVHPKETGVTLITLETCPNPRISELAFQEHRSLHEKHETVLEREYARAIQAAYAYQRDVVRDSHGATSNPFQAKLHLMMEVLKISKSKNRQRFLDKLCGQVEFDALKLDVSLDVPPHVAYSRFLIENLAYFDYITVGELLSTLALMEKLVVSTGTGIAHAMESQLFLANTTAEGPAGERQGEAQAGPAGDVAATTDGVLLRKFAAASVILLCLWEARTFIRRLYGLGASRRESKAKMPAKDLAKTPVKVQGVHGDKAWDEIASIMDGLGTRALMLERCKAFIELMNVDKEFKVGEEDEDMEGDAPATPSDDGDADAAGDRGRKRKANSTPGNRKKRARSSSRPRPRGRPRKHSVDVDAEAELEHDWV